jgi:hypothetical protein
MNIKLHIQIDRVPNSILQSPVAEAIELAQAALIDLSLVSPSATGYKKPIFTLDGERVGFLSWEVVGDPA